MQNIGCKISHHSLSSAHHFTYARLHAKTEIIQSLAGSVQCRCHAPFGSGQRNAVQQLPRMQQLKSRRAVKPVG
jgi:hypothetical protein